MHSKVKGLSLVVRVAIVGQMHVREERSTRNCVNWPKRDAAEPWLVGEKSLQRNCANSLLATCKALWRGSAPTFRPLLEGGRWSKENLGEHKGTFVGKIVIVPSSWIGEIVSVSDVASGRKVTCSVGGWGRGRRDGPLVQSKVETSSMCRTISRWSC